MRWSLTRATSVGLFLLCLVGLFMLVEFAFGHRSWFDIAIVATLAAVTTGAVAAVYGIKSSLSAALVSREELRLRLGQQQAVAQLGQLALTDISRQELLDEGCRVVAAELRADLAGVLELLPDGNAFVLRASVGWPAALAGVQEVPSGPGSHSGFTLTSSRPVIMSDAATERRFTLSQPMIAQGVTSGLSASIGSNGGTFGVISAHTYERREFSGHDITFLEAVASVLAGALRRRTAEEETEQTHRVLEAVIEGTTDAVFVKDLENRFIALNASAALTIGLPRKELIGRKLDDVLPRQIADSMTESDRATLERGTVDTFEETISRGAENIVFLTTKGPYRARDGTLLGTFGIARDITIRKAQEQNLTRSEERFRLAQEGAHMGTWDIDVASGVTTWSDGLRALYGVGADSPAGFEHFAPLVHPEDRARVTRDVMDAHENGLDFEFECRIVRADGELRWLLARSSVIRAEGGELVRALGVAVDITERKVAEEELAQSETERAQLEARLRQAEKLEAVGQLAGGVAHDFNNLLVAIRGYGELALERLARAEDGVAADVEQVLAAADRAATLTKQLLAFGRRQVLDPEVLDLNDVVRRTDALLQRVIGDNVELVTTLADHPVVVKADRGQLEQVITNLVINGRDAMPDGGVLTIRVATVGPERQALLSVTDEGTGIDAATASQIFEPYFTTKGDNGTGLGLATVHGIVAQSGGQIMLDTAPGRGTTFNVQLPLSTEKLPLSESMQAAGRSGGNETILLVEDDPAVRSIVSTMLAAHGYEMLDAADGNEAILQFETRERPIPLVVSDLLMRGLDGRQTIERIREIEPTTRALYMSGYSDDAIIRNGGLPPGTDFIQKPFSGDELASRIRELLDGDPARAT